MNDVNKFQEDVEVGVKEISLEIPIRVRMSSVYDTPFDFTTSIDDLGQIILTPVSKDVEFLDANTEDTVQYDTPILNQETIIITKTESYEEKEFSLLITATLLYEEGSSTHVSADVDEIGQCVIYPMNKDNLFTTVTTGDSLNLVTEEDEKTDENEIPKDVDAVVVENIDTTKDIPFTEDQLEKALKDITYNYRDHEGGVYCDTEYEQDTCAKILNKHYEQVSTGIEKERLTVFYSHETPELKESVSRDELMKILVRFLRGDIHIVSDPDFDPKESFIHLVEVDTNGYEYYYDPESDVIGVYSKK